MTFQSHNVLQIPSDNLETFTEIFTRSSPGSTWLSPESVAAVTQDFFKNDPGTERLISAWKTALDTVQQQGYDEKSEAHEVTFLILSKHFGHAQPDLDTPSMTSTPKTEKPLNESRKSSGGFERMKSCIVPKIQKHFKFDLESAEIKADMYLNILEKEGLTYRKLIAQFLETQNNPSRGADRSLKENWFGVLQKKFPSTNKVPEIAGKEISYAVDIIFWYFKHGRNNMSS